MLRRITTIALALALAAAPRLAAQGLPVGQPAQLGFSAERLARLDTLFQSYVDQGRTPGVVAHRRPGTARSSGAAPSAWPTARRRGR